MELNMSLSKTLRLFAIVAISSIAFSSCAGSKSSTDGYQGGGSSENGEMSSGGVDEDGKPIPVPERKVSKDELKETQKEATETETENHELRRQIFEAKNKLGIPVDQPAE